MPSQLPDYAKAALHYRVRDRDVLLLQEGVASWRKIGIPSASTHAREAGSAWHDAHATRVAAAARSRRLARAFRFAFLALVLLLSLIWVLRP